MKTRNFYLRIWMLCLAGYLWPAYNAMGGVSGAPLPQVCLFKTITHLPCPSCGATRAILVLLKGDFCGSVAVNPLGVLLFAGLILTPLWLVADVVMQRESFSRFYNTVEDTIRRRPAMSVCLMFLVVVNWIWTIAKCR